MFAGISTEDDGPLKRRMWNRCSRRETSHVPQSAAQAASCCRRSWKQFWTGLATSVFQKCARRSSSLQTSPSAPWEKHTQIPLYYSWHFAFFLEQPLKHSASTVSRFNLYCTRTPMSVWLCIQALQVQKWQGDSKTHKPGPDIQFTSVDYAWELEENGEPSPHPHAVLRRYIHVITCVVFERLPEKYETHSPL